jgi:hypothetical protein
LPQCRLKSPFRKKSKQRKMNSMGNYRGLNRIKYKPSAVPTSREESFENDASYYQLRLARIA